MIIRNDPKVIGHGLLVRWTRANTNDKAFQIMAWIRELYKAQWV